MRHQRAPLDARVGDEILDERRHPFRAAPDAVQICATRRVGAIVQRLLEHLSETVDRPQRRFQIVRDGVCESFQLLVRAAPLARTIRDALLQVRVQVAHARLAFPEVAIRTA